MFKCVFKCLKVENGHVGASVEHVSLATFQMKIIVLLFFLQFGVALERVKPLRDELKYLAEKFFVEHPLLRGV